MNSVRAADVVSAHIRGERGELARVQVVHDDAVELPSINQSADPNTRYKRNAEDDVRGYGCALPAKRPARRQKSGSFHARS